MRNLVLDGIFRLERLDTSRNLEASGALHGPGLLLIKRNFGGTREHFQLLWVIFLHIYPMLQSKVQETHPFCNKVCLISCNGIAQIQVYLRFSIVHVFVIAPLVISITY